MPRAESAIIDSEEAVLSPESLPTRHRLEALGYAFEKKAIDLQS
jgi:hypothetical protein